MVVNIRHRAGAGILMAEAARKTRCQSIISIQRTRGIVCHLVIKTFLLSARILNTMLWCTRFLEKAPQDDIRCQDDRRKYLNLMAFGRLLEIAARCFVCIMHNKLWYWWQRIRAWKKRGMYIYSEATVPEICRRKKGADVWDLPEVTEQKKLDLAKLPFLVNIYAETEFVSRKQASIWVRAGYCWNQFLVHQAT